MFKYTPRHILFDDNELSRLVKAVDQSFFDIYGSTSIIKSFRVYDAKTNNPWTKWLPEHGYNTHDHEHPWYHQFEGDVPAHHPPFGFDHDTEELLWHNEDDPKNPHRDSRLAQRPNGFHPMDYMIYDLAKKIRNTLGVPQSIAEEYIKQKVIQPAIDAFNAAHLGEHGDDAMHLLPNVDSVEWRRTTAGEYDRHSSGSRRMTRGSGTSPDGLENPLINYAINMGNVAHPNADSGVFIDSGINPIHREMRPLVNEHVTQMLLSKLQDPAVLQQYPQLSTPEHQQFVKDQLHALEDLRVDNRSYLNHSEIPLKQLTMGGIIQDKSTAGNRLYRKNAPLSVEDYHPLQVVDRAPDAFFGMKVGKPQGNLTAEMLTERLAEYGIKPNAKEADQLFRMPFVRMALSGDRRKNNVHGNILNKIAGELGLDPKRVKAYMQSIGTKKDGHTQTRGFRAIPAALTEKLMNEEGLSEQEASAKANQMFSEHGYQHQNHIHDDDAIRLGRSVMAEIRDKRGMSAIDNESIHYNAIGDEHLMTGHTTVPHETAEGHIHDNKAPSTTVEQQSIQETAAPPPAMAEAPPMGNMPPQLPQGQMTLDQFPTKAHVAEITEAMEHIQLEDAKRDDSILKMVPHNPIQLNSIQSVGLFAKDLGITSMDVHGLLHSRGDWHRIAKEWSVSPQVVKVVKVTFSGGV